MMCPGCRQGVQTMSMSDEKKSYATSKHNQSGTDDSELESSSEEHDIRYEPDEEQETTTAAVNLRVPGEPTFDNIQNMTDKEFEVYSTNKIAKAMGRYTTIFQNFYPASISKHPALLFKYRLVKCKCMLQ